MPVYVDRVRHRYRRMIMCHMIADSLAELHAMADQIGIARRWFQDHPRCPHYDICLSKRALAVKAGAIDADRRTFVEAMGRLRRKRAREGSGPLDA